MPLLSDKRGQGVSFRHVGFDIYTLSLFWILFKIHHRQIHYIKLRQTLSGFTCSREHEGTERDTPSHRFVICHSH